MEKTRSEVHIPMHGPKKGPLLILALLEFMMARPNKVLRRETLLDELWGYDYAGDSRTLDVHIKRVRGKVEINPGEPRHVLTVRGVGYKFSP